MHDSCVVQSILLGLVELKGLPTGLRSIDKIQLEKKSDILEIFASLSAIMLDLFFSSLFNVTRLHAVSMLWLGS